MVTINKVWHAQHTLSMPSTLPERVQWHEQHLKHCGCRKDLPKTIVAALKEQGKKVCSRGHIYSGRGPCPACWPGRLKQHLKSVPSESGEDLRRSSHTLLPSEY